MNARRRHKNKWKNHRQKNHNNKARHSAYFIPSMTDSQLSTVLIIDDDEDYRKFLKNIIGKLLPQLQVREYDPVALGAPRNNFDWSAHDVLILDYHLHLEGITGLDILQKHHKKINFPATIMLTGAGNEEVAIRALQFNISEYLRKESLTKDKLKQSITESWETNKKRRKKQEETTSYNKSFSKELFYQKLEQPKGPYGLGPERALLVIQLDNADQLGEEIGLIALDNLVKHVAKNSFDVFKAGACNPNITSTGDTTIALQIDAPDNYALIEFNLTGLCDHLRKRDFKFSDHTHKYTVSIGVLLLDGRYTTASQILGAANQASELAKKADDNSYYIWKKTDIFMEETTEEPELAEQVRSIEEEKEQFEKETRIAEEEISRLTQQAQAIEKEQAKLDARAHKDAKEKAAVDRDKPELNESIIKKALDEKRWIQLYQPIITMSAGDDSDQTEVFDVTLRVLDEHGSMVDMDKVNTHEFSIGLQQSIDQWMLRQVIRGIIQSRLENRSYTFMLSISEAWFCDISLFNWLQKILSEYKEHRLGKSIILGIYTPAFLQNKNRAIPLITSLHKSHGFRIALAGVTNFDELPNLINETRSSIVLVSLDEIELLNTVKSEESDAGTNDKDKNDDDKEEPPSPLQSLKDKKIKFMTNRIKSSIELTQAIALGTDYALGEFIGEHQDIVGNISNVESFELN